jgi:hypothetical protein
VSGIAFKVAAGAFLVWLSAQMGSFVDDLLERVRESVQASELLEIDRYVDYHAVFGDDPSRKTHAPADQAEFERVLAEWITSQGGRNVARDRWDEPYVYEKLDSPDPRDVRYRITSKGPDRKLGTDDDIALERDGDHATINRDPSRIAEEAIERKARLDREVGKRVQELLKNAPAPPSQPVSGASTNELVALLGRDG